MDRNSRLVLMVEAGVFLMAVLLLALYFYADSRILTMDTNENNPARVARHYTFISEDDSDLWQTAFSAAVAEAGKQDAYLEWIGKGSPVDYDASDCMRIATASGVDGILLHKSGNTDMTELINRAMEEKIPVITIFSDQSGSERISYVGLNNYQLGENYAGQILECLKTGENQVLVISSAPLGEGEMALMYSQMVRATDESKQADQTVVFEALEISSTSGFDAEEAVRDVFISRTALPDVIVCLDQVITECVSQALVDFNEVGNVSVIGFYASHTISEAISRGIIYSTLEIDAEQIGRIGVDALDEYWSQGRVSNYFNVGLSVINAGNVEKTGDTPQGE